MIRGITGRTAVRYTNSPNKSRDECGWVCRCDTRLFEHISANPTQSSPVNV